jgi:hypothetical protein
MLNDDFYGDRFRWWVGVVKQVADDRARVRVRIFGIHPTENNEKVSDGDLPWALVLYPTTGSQTSGGNLSHNLVNGSWVVGMFADGVDSQQPIILGVVNGGQGSINSSSSPEGVNTSQGSSPINVPSSRDSAPSTTQLTGSDNAKKAYNYFWERIAKEGSATGDKKILCAAIVGNLQIESGNNIDPQAYNPNDKGAVSAGIAQWQKDRLINLCRFCGLGVVPQKGGLPPLEQQLDFIWHEFHSPEKRAYGKLLGSTSLEDAVVAMIYYERDASYQKIGGAWTVNTTSPFYTKKLIQAQKVLSSFSYTGASSNQGRER